MTSRGYMRGVFITLGIYVLVFVLMVLFVMSDEPTTNAGRTMHLFLQYICGFPLVLLHPNLPFFIESPTPASRPAQGKSEFRNARAGRLVGGRLPGQVTFGALA